MMSNKVIQREYWTVEEHPNKELCFEWIRHNWHDLGEFALQEAIESLKAFAEHLGLRVDYALGIHSDRSEHITFNGVNEKALACKAFTEQELSGKCPFTGVCYDETLLDAFRKANKTDKLIDTLEECASDLMQCLHSEGDYLYSDAGLEEMCIANEYYFDEFGVIE